MTKPLLLTVTVLYTAVLRIAIQDFPPVAVPTIKDLLVLMVLIILLMRVVLTYQYDRVVPKYGVDMFLLETCIALLFGWQLRFLASVPASLKPSEADVPLVLFYVLHVGLVLTMIVWGRLASKELKSTSAQVRGPVAGPKTVQWIRGIGMVLPFLGIGVEYLSCGERTRTGGRWLIAVSLLSLSIRYAYTQPWKRLEAMEAMEA